MYSHLSCNDATGGVDFTDPDGWFLHATIAPLAGSYSAYGLDGASPWIQVETDAGSFRLIGVAWVLHSGSPPPDASGMWYLVVAPNRYISVKTADAVDSVYAFQHQSSFDNVYGNGIKPTVAEVLGTHPVDLLSDFAKERVDGTSFADVILLNNQGGQAFSNNGKDSVTGGNGDDEIAGGNGKDWLAGGGGQDRLDGGNGNDRLYGGADNDELHGDAGNDTVYGGDGQDAIYGESGKDRLFGDADDDRLFGSTGKDQLSGGDGQDKLYGDAAADTLFGGDDNDELYGGGGNDRLDGGIGQDKLYGDAGSDKLYGGADNDEVYGSAGNDRLFGGIGQDFMNGDAGKDVLHGDADNDTLNGLAGSDKLFGGIGQDRLFGGAGADKLKGDDDNDRLDGGPGKDLLSGGAGANTFVFSSALGASNIDRIADFKVGFDSIELSRSVFKALSPGPLSESEFHRGAHAKGAGEHILYDPHAGTLIYDADGSGKGGAIVFARLDDHLKLGHTDFLVV